MVERRPVPSAEKGTKVTPAERRQHEAFLSTLEQSEQDVLALLRWRKAKHMAEKTSKVMVLERSHPDQAELIPDVEASAYPRQFHMWTWLDVFSSEDAEEDAHEPLRLRLEHRNKKFELQGPYWPGEMDESFIEEDRKLWDKREKVMEFRERKHMKPLHYNVPGATPYYRRLEAIARSAQYWYGQTENPNLAMRYQAHYWLRMVLKSHAHIIERKARMTVKEAQLEDERRESKRVADDRSLNKEKSRYAERLSQLCASALWFIAKWAKETQQAHYDDHLRKWSWSWQKRDICNYVRVLPKTIRKAFTQQLTDRTGEE